MAKKVVPNFVYCNGQMLKNLRIARGWTQKELGIRAGFSVRTIQKAEAGMSIEMSTVEFLAAALSEPTQIVTPEMLVVSNVTLCETFCECFSKQLALQGHLEEIQSRISDYVDVSVTDCRRLTVFDEKYRGFDGVIQFLDVARKAFDVAGSCFEFLSDEKEEIVTVFVGSLHRSGSPSCASSMAFLRFTFKAIELQAVEFVFDTGILIE